MDGVPMTNSFMSSVIAFLAAGMYFAAPFLADTKKALHLRLGSEFLFAVSFLYFFAFSGIVYYALLTMSTLMAAKLEHNKLFSRVFGLIGTLLILLANEAGQAGYMLAVSFGILFLHLDDHRWMVTNAYIDALSALLLARYCLSVHAWMQMIFAVLLLLTAIMHIYSALQLQRANHFQPAVGDKTEPKEKRG